MVLPDELDGRTAVDASSARDEPRPVGRRTAPRPSDAAPPDRRRTPARRTRRRVDGPLRRTRSWTPTAPRSACSSAARAPYVWDADGTPLPRPARRDRGQRPRPRAPRGRRRRSPRSSATLGHMSNLFATPRADRARRAAPRAGARRPGGFARVLLQLRHRGQRGRVQDRPAQRRTARPRILALEGAFHGRTMGALALTGQGRQPRAVRAAARRRRVRAVRRHRRARRPPTRRATSPRCSSSRSRARPACGRCRPGYLARGPRAHRAARRAAGPRRGADRHRPHRRVARPPAPPAAASRPTSSPSPRASAAASRSARSSRTASAPATLLHRGQHGTTFGGNPVAAAAALAALDGDRARRPARPRADARRAAARRRRGAATTRWSSTSAGGACCVGVVLTAPMAAHGRDRARGGGFPRQRRAPRPRCGSPRRYVLTDDQAACVDFVGLPLDLGDASMARAPRTPSSAASRGAS